MTKFIRDPFTNKTFTLKDWEIEKQRRKEQMASEHREKQSQMKKRYEGDDMK